MLEHKFPLQLIVKPGYKLRLSIDTSRSIDDEEPALVTVWEKVIQRRAVFDILRLIDSRVEK